MWRKALSVTGLLSGRLKVSVGKGPPTYQTVDFVTPPLTSPRLGRDAMLRPVFAMCLAAALIMAVPTEGLLSVRMPQAAGVSVRRHRAAPRLAVTASTPEEPEKQSLQRPPNRPRTRSDRTTCRDPARHAAITSSSQCEVAPQLAS